MIVNSGEFEPKTRREMARDLVIGVALCALAGIGLAEFSDTQDNQPAPEQQHSTIITDN